ncbi:hypothetical protein BRADI_4g15114v3 [Brachypodium distachyon]|uniref:Uncharacterized protein n=1 Tax=Brachypodium distachyon TaxID=15368 RepID=A0A0Q3EP58_BRADI|nr:hypothetical protein BRADI_4g15114v3 [Brachypodium distachyon]
MLLLLWVCCLIRFGACWVLHFCSLFLVLQVLVVSNFPSAFVFARGGYRIYERITYFCYAEREEVFDGILL